MAESITKESAFENLLRDVARDVRWLPPGMTLQDGRFIVQRHLGGGGMGQVYAVEDREQGAVVALKALSDLTAAGIYRLKNEFRGLADVRHPHLVTLHELYLEGDLWFFTMELVSGEPISRHFGPESDVALLRHVFSQLAEGVHFLHDAGKLHRDLKPSNVLWADGDRTVILDFGLVSDTELGGIGQTLCNDGLCGTPAYMAPEQAAGVAATPASDWYAIGVMLFEACSGRPPLTGNANAVVAAKRREDAPSLASLRGDVPPDIVQLCAGLLARDPNRRPGYNEIVAVLNHSSIAETAVHPPVPAFIGRRAELAELERALAATDRGGPEVVCVSGVSGIGKTCLVERALAQFRREDRAVVLTGRCYQREHVPFPGVDSLIDALSRYLRALPESEVTRLVPRHARALIQLFPVLGRVRALRRGHQRHPLPTDPQHRRRLAFAAVRELFCKIADHRPTVLFVDDVQWSDIEAAELLLSLCTAPDGPALLLVLAYRTDEAEHSPGLRAFLTAADGHAPVRWIELGELGDDEARALAHALLPPLLSDLAGPLALEAKRTPFFIAELAQDVVDHPGTRDTITLETALSRRVAELGPSARAVLQLVCLCGRPVAPELVAAAAPEHDVPPCWRVLEGARLLRRFDADPATVVAYHDRIRECVVAAIDPELRRTHHLRLAQALERSADVDAVALTEHYCMAGDLARAGFYAEVAGRHAVESFAFARAAECFADALRWAPGDAEHERGLRIELAEVLANAGRGAEAAEAFMTAADGAPSATALELRRQAAQQWFNVGHMDAGVRELGAVLATVGLRPYSSPARAIAALLVNRAFIALAEPLRSTLPERKLSSEAQVELRACEIAMVGLWAADTLQAAAFCARYLRLALHSRSRDDQVRGWATEAVCRSVEGVCRRTVVYRFLAHAERLAEGIDDPETRAYLELTTGMAKFSQAELAAALPHLLRAERITSEECTRRTSYLEIAQSFIGACYAYLGRWAVMREAWDGWVEAARASGNLQQLTLCRTWTAGCYRWLAENEPEVAQTMLRDGINQWQWRKLDLQHLLASLSQAYVHLYRGDAHQAYELLGPLSRQFAGTAMARVQMHRVKLVFSYAGAAVALAASLRDRRDLLAKVEAQARRLEREAFPMARPHVPQLRAAVAYLRGDAESARNLLGRAIAAFEEVDYRLHAAAARWQLGRLVGGDEGAANTASAEACMRAEGIVLPERVVNLLAPGFTT